MRATPQRPQPRPRVTPDLNFAPDSLPTAAAINRNTAAPIRRNSLTAAFLFKKKFFRSLRSLIRYETKQRRWYVATV